MKRLFVFLMLISLIVVSCCPSANAQTPAKPSPEQYLTADQLAKYQSDLRVAELEKKLQTYGNWVGVGGEIGIAVREGLGAVVDVSEQFGKTDVGKFTMIMIAWKVMGKDVIKIFIGLVFLFAALLIAYKSMRKTILGFNRKVKGNGLQFWKPKEYEWVDGSFRKHFDEEGYVFMWFLHVAFILGSIGITYAIMF